MLGHTRMRYFINLRTSILCIVLLAVIPAITLIAIDGLGDRDRALNETHQRACRQSEQASQHLAQLVEGLRHILLVISRETIVANFETHQVNNHLRDLLGHLPHVVNLGVTDARGMVVASGMPITGPVDLAERRYLKKALQDNAFVCGVYQVGKITHIETVNFAYPLSDDGNAPWGVVYAALDLQYFQSILNGITVPPGGDVTVLDADDRILYSRLDTVHRTGELFPTAHAPFGFKGNPSLVSIEGLDNVQRIYSIRTVSGVEGLRVLVGLPAGEGLAVARRALTRDLMLMGTVTVLSMVLAWLLGNLFIIRRVHAMSRAFDDIAAGNFATRSGLVNDRDELGRLADAFDRMALSLQKRDNELCESQEKFYSLFHYSPVPCSVSNVEDNRLMDVNQVFTELFGFVREDVIGKTALELGLVEHTEQQECFEILKARGRVSAYPTMTRIKSGDVLSILWSADIIQIDGRACLISSAVDITAIKTAEQEREKIQLQLNQAQKMESVGRLAGGVAHDFNNMLGVILGHAELALIGVDADKSLYNSLMEIRKAAERSAVLTRQLLAFARKQTITPRVLDFNTTVESMLKMLQRLIGEDIDLVWLPGKNVWPVMLDPGQVDQVLANLCVNARDAIAGEGKVTIETGTVVLDEFYCADHAGFMPGEYVLLTVSDNGCGMERQMLTHIFEPFFTTKGLDKGTGLGLAMVYGIVKQNDGFVNVYSEQGQGTTISLYFRRYQGACGSTCLEEVAVPAARGSETILLVEDEKAMLKMITGMLAQQGYSVLAASTPGEAIRVAEEHCGEIDLLMTDVILPEMNGRELSNTLLVLYPGLKRLFMSGYTSDAIVHHGVLAEGVCFLQKPFSLKDLAARIREALES